MLGFIVPLFDDDGHYFCGLVLRGSWMIITFIHMIELVTFVSDLSWFASNRNLMTQWLWICLGNISLRYCLSGHLVCVHWFLKLVWGYVPCRIETILLMVGKLIYCESEEITYWNIMFMDIFFLYSYVRVYVRLILPDDL